MATKSGKAQLCDLRQGRTFHMVRLIVNPHGDVETPIKTVYCNSWPFLKKPDPQLFTKLVSSVREPYVSIEPVWFSPKELEYAHYAYQYNLGSADNRNDTQHVNSNRWLFTTRRHAEKFARDLRSTFVPSEEMLWSLWHYERWQKDFVRSIMNNVSAGESECQ